MARTYRFVVGKAEAGVRLDRYLARHLPASVSRAMIQRGVRDGGIAVGDRTVKAHYKVRAGDIITASFGHLPARSRDLDVAPQELPLEIVYEDDTLLVVNKPSGLVTHPAPGHWDSTLVNAILWHFQDAPGSKSNLNRERQLPRAGIVHRLDKDTSGLLLVAKTEMAHASLSKQLKARTIRRRYLAVVEGRLPLDTGTVNVPIGRHLTHRKQMTVRHLGGRAAVTHYRVLKRVGSRLKALGSRQGQLPPASSLPGPPLGLQAGAGQPPAFVYSVVEMSLETGRTHQIRVHMAHLGFPIAGDPTYGKRPASFWQAHGVTRQLLHAYQLSFQHPMTKRPVTLTAPIPADMAPWIEGVRRS